MLTVYNHTRSSYVIAEGRLANSFWSRGKGLIGTKQLRDGEGLVIEPCNSVHCCFMSIPIDVIYVDKEGLVVGVDEALRPWRIGRPRWQAHQVMEVPVGTIRATNTQVGDRLSLQLEE